MNGSDMLRKSVEMLRGDKLRRKFEGRRYSNLYKVDTKELRAQMARRGYTTIGQLTDVTGINRNTLSDILNGESYPSGIVMQKIVKALELEPEAAGRIFFAPAPASDASICE